MNDPIINIAEVLRVVDSSIPVGERYEKLFTLVRYMMGDQEPDPTTSGDLRRDIEALKASMRDINTWREEIMAKIDEHAAELSAKLDANTAQAAKAFAEIREALDKALEAQITQAELDAAVEAAKTAATSEANAANDAAVDAAFTTLQDKVTAQQSALQALDDIVPDAPPTV